MLRSSAAISEANQRYRSLALASRLEAASPHALVAILYEELGRALDVIVAKLDRGGSLRGDAQVDRAQRILMALLAGLDGERGGALAAALAGVYRAMSQQLSKAVAGHDRDALTELRSGVSELAESWSKIS